MGRVWIVEYWNSFSQGDLQGADIYYGSGGILYQVQDYTGTVDTDSNAPQVEIITRDIDENALDLNKMFTRLSVKLEDVASAELTFTLTGSIDRGNNWKSL